jgi:hypothetical protein
VKLARLLAGADWDYGYYDFHLLLTTTMASADAPKAARVLLAAFEQETDPHARWMLAAGLLLVSQRLGPVEAARNCAPVLPALIAAFNHDKEQYYSYMAEGLVAVVSALEPPRAREAMQTLGYALDRRPADSALRSTLLQGLVTAGARVAPEQAARLIGVYLDREQDSVTRGRLASGLVTPVEAMTKTGAASPADIARMLNLALEHKPEPFTRTQVASILAGLAEKMDGPDAEKVRNRAADLLISAAEKDEAQLSDENLATLIDKMPKQDAAFYCRRGARVIAGQIERDPGGSEMVGFGSMGFGSSRGSSRPSSMARLASQMVPAEADTLCREVIRSVLKKLQSADIPIIPLLSQLEPETARRLATELALWTCAQGEIDDQRLDEILTERGRAGIMVRENNQPPPTKPLPCRLTTQALVDLLKMPTCFGEARQVALDHLGNRYGRRFFNHWEFVRFAEEQNLGLDFTTTPKRPDPRESVKRMLEILDEPGAGR